MRYLLAFLALASVAWAQPRAYFPWWESPLARDLGLSPEQQQRIRSILREYRDEMVDLRARVEKAEMALEDLFNQDQPPEPQAASKVINELVEARSALTRRFAEMSLKLRFVLTPEQWRRVQERRPRWAPGFRGGLPSWHSGRPGEPQQPRRPGTPRRSEPAPPPPL